jgi:hypothetical protein
MTSKTFTSGTVIDSAWLNDVNTTTYKGAVNVRQAPYNATGLGVVSDSAAIQAALDTGQNVYIPKGTYLITTPLQLKTTLQQVYGDGLLTILLRTTNIEIMYSSTSVYGVALESLQFNCTVSEVTTGPTQFHVHFGTGASGCNIRNCAFNTALTGTYVRTTHHAGVWFEGANLNNILDCTFGQAQILMGSTDSTIRGGYIYSFSFEYAIKITSAGDVVVDSVRGILGGASQGCIWIPSASYMNKIVNNYFGGSYTTINIGNGITADQQQMLQVIGNTFHEVDKIAVNLTNPASGNVISGNSFWAGHSKQNDPTFATPGYQDILITGSSFGPSGTVISGNIFNRFVGPIEDGMPGVGKSNAIEFNGAYAGTNNLVEGNSVSGARYYAPAIVNTSVNDVVRNNVGTTFSGTWTPTDLSGASLAFTSVSCKWSRTADAVTVWGSFTFPTTASGAGVTIGGLPFAPAAGMMGAVSSVNTNSTTGQKIKLSVGNTYFFIATTVDVQVVNSACSTNYFAFTATYLI